MSSDEDMKVDRQPHLMKQDASIVDPSKLTALTPEVVSNYPSLSHLLRHYFMLAL